MTDDLRIAIGGLGTVGIGVLKLLAEHATLLNQRCGRGIRVVAVSARDKNREREIDLSGYQWVDNAIELADLPEVDVVVELIGGSEGTARAVVERAIKNNKSVVTANKALLAHHGLELARFAESAGVSLSFEAAVAGGIPILKALRESLAGNQLKSVHSILNGTCNFILTAMEQNGRSFDNVLAEAQKLGFAEEDPSFDVDGIDSAHKLALLTSLAFGMSPDLDAIYVEGIRGVTLEDLNFADELGYRIKLLAIARRSESGIEQRVHPCMVPLDTPIAHVDGVFNAIVAEGDYVGRTVFEGEGAGAGPTASAVVSDLVDIARGQVSPPFGRPTSTLGELTRAPMENHRGPYYVRLIVVDRPGVMADIAAILRDEQVSIESLLQRGRAPNEPVTVVMTMHDASEAAMTNALQRINDLEIVLEPPHMIRIEHF